MNAKKKSTAKSHTNTAQKDLGRTIRSISGTLSFKEYWVCHQFCLDFAPYDEKEVPPERELTRNQIAFITGSNELFRHDLKCIITDLVPKSVAEDMGKWLDDPATEKEHRKHIADSKKSMKRLLLTSHELKNERDERMRASGEIELDENWRLRIPSSSPLDLLRNLA